MCNDYGMERAQPARTENWQERSVLLLPAQLSLLLSAGKFPGCCHWSFEFSEGRDRLVDHLPSFCCFRTRLLVCVCVCG